MAHYAILNNDNIVVDVIPGVDENQTIDDMSPEEWYLDFYKTNINSSIKDCKRTSYNTSGNVHTKDGTPFRKNYAGRGFSYDESKDAFIQPKPYTSWILNETTYQWDPPVPYPVAEGGLYRWDEETTNWINLEG